MSLRGQSREAAIDRLRWRAVRERLFVATSLRFDGSAVIEALLLGAQRLDLRAPPVDGARAKQVANRPPLRAFDAGSDDGRASLHMVYEISLGDPLGKQPRDRM